MRGLMEKRHIVILSLLFFIANLGIIGNSSAQNTDEMLIESDVTWTDGEKYVGEYKDGQRSGQGIYIFADGRKEVGEFKNGKLNGYAITYFANGSIDKEGIFKDNEFLYAQTKTLPNCPSSGYFHNCFGLLSTIMETNT